MFFIKPGQVYSVEFDENVPNNRSGYILQLHPDFLWNSALAKKIGQFEFFGYSVHEALFVSEKEEKTLLQIFRNIQQEYESNIDEFSQDLIIAQLELLLKYADRFYHRQFITRKIAHHAVLDKLEAILNNYFENGQLAEKGLPTPQLLADELNMTRNYLNSVLKSLTNQTTQQHIHEKLIEKAKEILSTTNLSVSEIAYTLGFEHSQSFSKLFKTKTNVSPLEFRQSFN